MVLGVLVALSCFKKLFGKEDNKSTEVNDKTANA